MSTFVGKDGAVHVGGTAMGEVRDFSVEQSSEVVNDTVMGDTWMTNKATQKSWTASVNCLWDDGDAQQTALTVGAEVTLTLYPEGSAVGAYELSGTAIVTGVSTSTSYDGLVEVSFSATGTGALTIGTA